MLGKAERHFLPFEPPKNEREEAPVPLLLPDERALQRSDGCPFRAGPLSGRRTRFWPPRSSTFERSGTPPWHVGRSR